MQNITIFWKTVPTSFVAYEKCPDEHKIIECNSNIERCINCIKTVEILKINIDCNHTAFEKNYPVHTRVVVGIRSKVNYQ